MIDDDAYRQALAKAGRHRYHALFNEQIVARYITEVAFDSSTRSRLSVADNLLSPQIELMSKQFALMYEWLFPNRDILAGMTLIFTASAFVLRPASVWAMTFYLGFLPTTLHQFYCGERPHWKNPLFIITCLLLAWTALTLFWGENPGKERVPKFALGALFTTLYVVGLSMALRKNSVLERRIGSVFIFMGAANAAISVIYYLSPFSSAPRLGGGRKRVTQYSEP